MRWSKCSWYSKPYDASCHKCQRGRLVERCLVSGRGISVYDYRARDVYVWLLDKLDKGCLCVITGQGMCMYDCWTRDICVWLPGKGCVCMITGQGISVYDYRARDVYLWLLDKGCVCMITGQAGQGMSVITGNGISVYNKWAWDCVNDSSKAHFDSIWKANSETDWTAAVTVVRAFLAESKGRRYRRLYDRCCFCRDSIQNRTMSVCPSVVALYQRLNRSLGLHAIRYCNFYD